MKAASSEAARAEASATKHLYQAAAPVDEVIVERAGAGRENRFLEVASGPRRRADEAEAYPMQGPTYRNAADLMRRHRVLYRETTAQPLACLHSAHAPDGSHSRGS